MMHMFRKASVPINEPCGGGPHDDAPTAPTAVGCTSKVSLMSSPYQESFQLSTAEERCKRHVLLEGRPESEWPESLFLRETRTGIPRLRVL